MQASLPLDRQPGQMLMGAQMDVKEAEIGQGRIESVMPINNELIEAGFQTPEKPLYSAIHPGIRHRTALLLDTEEPKAEAAAHLVDHVFPPLPVRQSVLAVPKRLRTFLLYLFHAFARQPQVSLRRFLSLFDQAVKNHDSAADRSATIGAWPRQAPAVSAATASQARPNDCARPLPGR